MRPSWRDTLDEEAGASSSTRAPIRRALGRFTLLEEIGAGGMGEVYRAYDPELDRQVAIKRLTFLQESDNAARLRLQREAQAIARLSHANVVQVFDVGRDADSDDVFIAMELVEGVTLRRWLQTSRSWRAIAAVFAQAGRGLMAAHERGVVHRDFKPENVLVTPEGIAKVVDFGLAKPLVTVADADADADAPQDSGHFVPPTWPEAPASGSSGPSGPSGGFQSSGGHVTPIGARIGTPAYMPPEHISGMTSDARADQFSFAVALYEAFVRRLPFRGKSPAEYAVAMLETRPLPFPRRSPVPRRLQRMIMRALSREPAQRFATLAPLLAELEAKPAQRRRRFAVFGGAVVLGALLTRASSSLVGGTDPMSRACEERVERMSEVWSDEQREALISALRAAPVPFAAGTAKRAAQGLDDLGHRWRIGARSACMAAGMSADPIDGARERCFGRALERQRELVLALSVPSATVAQHAVQGIARARHELDRCALPAHLAAIDGSDASDDGTRIALDRARQQLSLGETADSLAALADAHSNDPAVAFELATVRGRLQHASGDPRRARTTFESAAFAGLGQASPLVAAEWNQAYGDALYELGDIEAMAAPYARAQRMYADALGDDAVDSIVAAATLGHAPYARGDYEQALSTYESASVRLAAVVDATDPTRLLVDEWVALSSSHLGRLTQARAQMTDLVARTETALGPGHPRTLELLHALAVVELRAGQAERARELLTRVLVAREADAVAQPIDHAAVLANLGAALNLLERDDEAAEALQRALGLLQGQGLASDHPNVLAVQANLGSVLVDQKRFAEAEPLLATALERYEAGGHAATSNALMVRYNLAACRTALGQTTELVPMLSRGVDLAVEAGDTVQQGRLALALARAYDDAGDRTAADGALARAEVALSDPAAHEYAEHLRAYRARRMPPTP